MIGLRALFSRRTKTMAGSLGGGLAGKCPGLHAGIPAQIIPASAEPPSLLLTFRVAYANTVGSFRLSQLVLQLDDVTGRNLKQREIGRTGDNILSLNRFIADRFA
jgi:hypothetical protein